MRESPTSLNIEDFRQRYGRSFGWLIDEKTNSKRLIQITDITSGQVSFDTKEGSGFFAYVNRGAVFEFLPITRGWFRSSEHGPMLFQRIPARQYSRGISKGNTSVSGINYGQWFGITLSLPVLHEVFVSPVKEDIKAFIDGKQESFIINKFFMLKHSVVYFYGLPIGTYKGTEITLTTDVVAQELRDAVSRQNLPFVVKVAE